MTKPIFLFFLFLPIALFAQNGFQKVIENQASDAYSQIKTSPDGKSAYMLNSSDGISMQLIKMDEMGTILWSKKITFSQSFILYGAFCALDDGVIFSRSAYANSVFEYSQLLRFDASGMLLWSKRIPADDFFISEITVDDASNFWLVAHAGAVASKKSFQLVQLDPDGNILQSKNIGLNSQSISAWHVIFDKKTASILVDMIAETFQLDSPQYILSFDMQMNLKWARVCSPRLRMLSWSKMNDNILFLGFINRNLGTPSSLVTGTIKITDGTFSLMKVFQIKDYPYISTNSNGVIMSHYDSHKIAKYDENLNVNWTKKSSRCFNQTFILPALTENGTCFFSKVVPQYPAFIYGKIDSQGEIATCELLDAPPIFIKDTTFEQNEPFLGCVINPKLLKTIDMKVDIENTVLFSKDYCPKSNAIFSIPTTACLNTTFSPSNVQHPSAAHDWQYSTLSKAYVPSITYDLVGEKTVKHTVTVDGCSDTMSQKIRILGAPTLPKDTQVCGKKPLIWNFEKNNIISYFIDNQSFTPPLVIEKSGDYTLKFSNGVCKSERVTRVEFVDLPPVIFQLDSAYCEDEPYVAQISGFEKVVWDAKTIADTLQIRDNSKHFYEASIGICSMKGTLIIPRKTCPLPEIMFVPNTFSPNDDGLNDTFQAFGDGFQLLKMTIFDRWGTQLYIANAATPTWNGMFRGNAVAQDVYVYFIEYQDIKRNITRVKKGSVFLTR